MAKKNKASNQKVNLDLPSAKNYRIFFTIISVVLIFIGLTRQSDFGKCFVLFLSSFFTVPALMFHHEVKKLTKEQQSNSNDLIENKPKKDIYLIVYMILIFISFSVWFSSCTKDDNSTVSTNSETAQKVTTVSSGTSIETTITTPKETTITTTTTKEITVNPKYLTTVPETTNPLMALSVKTAEIPKIDKNRGYIEISKEDFSKISKSEYLEFCENVVSPSSSKYNYFTVDFGNGTGICYAGCFIYDGTYGILDNTGAVIEKQGSISIDLTTKDITSDIFSFKTVDEIQSTVTVTVPTTEEITTVLTTSIIDVTTKEKIKSTTNDRPITSTYVLNTSTMKFHKSTCKDVDKIKEENYSTFDGSRDEIIGMGYEPCGHCKP